MAKRDKQLARGAVFGSWWALWCLALCPRSAHAEFTPRILVVSSANVSPAARKAARSAIASQGELCSDADYANEAGEQDLSPHSAEAIERVGTAQHARLIALLAVRSHRLVVNFLDGRNAAPVHDVSVKVERRGLSSSSAREIAEATHLALTILQAQQYTAAPPVVPIQPNVIETPLPEPAPEAGAFTGMPAAAAAAESSEEVPPDAEPENVSESPAAVASLEDSDRLLTAVGIGIGVGSRSVHLPTAAGERSLASGPFPAFDLGLSAQAPLGDNFLFGAHARYQTSVGLVARETPVADLASQHTALRSHRLELGLLPGYRFSRSPNSVSLNVFIGWGFRGLRPVIDISVPGSTLSGLVLRPELRIPIASDLVSLRIAPELFGVVVVTAALRKAGNTQGSGLGLGVELAIELRVVRTFHLALTYRESHVSVDTPWMDTLRDVERFVTLQGVLIF